MILDCGQLTGGDDILNEVIFGVEMEHVKICKAGVIPTWRTANLEAHLFNCLAPGFYNHFFVYHSYFKTAFSFEGLNSSHHTFLFSFIFVSLIIA